MNATALALARVIQSSIHLSLAEPRGRHCVLSAFAVQMAIGACWVWALPFR